jgi:hypothetical protein
MQNHLLSSINSSHACEGSLISQTTQPIILICVSRERESQPAMGSKGVKISSVLICALMLGVILEQVQVEAKKGKSCCKSTTARNCYNVCRLEFSQTVCASTCGCKIVPGITSRDQCPKGYKNLSFIPESGTNNSSFFPFCSLLSISS